ncbi:MAG: amino acid deaminase/aldolase [Actinomycetota bacterium]|nr:amino acid deaminase/aldolase [Actinomycetota bacterium]
MPAAADYERYENAFGDRDAPFAFVDLDAMWANAAEMLGRAGGKPIRVASKSVRCREILRRILARDGFRGLMTYTLRESQWLGLEDMLLAYPTADREALRRDPLPVLMIDSVEHLDLIGRPARVCIEVDMSYPIARTRIGPKRSPIRTADQAAALARAAVDRGFTVAGVMGYEGHVAGVGDRPAGKRVRGAAIRAMQRASVKEMASRRAEIVAAVNEVTPLEFVNGGGTGSLHTTSEEDAVTELTAGSGFYAPALFDAYSAFTLRPAAMFALPVVRRPSAKVATCLGGGYIASGAAATDRLPVPHLPAGLELDAQEGAGEVQTPVSGTAARHMRVGDRVYFRHAKAGELCEHFDSLLLLEGGRVVDEVPTYRGEGKLFL